MPVKKAAKPEPKKRKKQATFPKGWTDAVKYVVKAQVPVSYWKAWMGLTSVVRPHT